MTFSFDRLGGNADALRWQHRSRFGNLIPQASLRWSNGAHNWMTYITGDIPVGAYDSTRLSNIGIGHGAIDAGAGYTYLNPQTGHEFSGVLGFTYNFTNQSTQCRRRHAFRLGRVPILDQAVPGRRRRLRAAVDLSWRGHGR